MVTFNPYEALIQGSNSPFIVYCGETYLFKQIAQKVDELAAALCSYGLVPGDRVVISLVNGVEFVLAYLSVMVMGCIAVPISPAFSACELQKLCSIVDAKLIISSCEGVHGAKSMDELLKEAHGIEIKTNYPTKSPQDIAVILFTSGTTGEPKGVCLTYENIAAQLNAAGDALEVQKGERMLGCLSLNHVFGQMDVLLLALVKGCTVYLMNRFSAGEALSTIVEDRINVVVAVPTMYELLIRSLRGSGLRPQNFEALRVCHSGAAALSAELLHRIEKGFGVIVQEGYGLTETCSMAFSNPLDSRRKPQSVGKPIRGVASRVVDGESNMICSPNQVGEVQISGSIVSPAYWPLDRGPGYLEGWLSTGDLGYFDSDGYLFLVGRSKEMIVRAGHKIYPREVEEVLSMHPDVLRTAVVGAPSKLAGQKVIAFVEISAQPEATPKVLMELKQLCVNRLAGYKIPSIFKVVAEFPLTSSGKIQKHKLLEQL